MSNHNYSCSAIWSDEDKCYVATSVEFEGLAGLGDTVTDSVENLREAIAMACDELASKGTALPRPRRLTYASGQSRLRLPKSMHERLAQCADLEGVSMNSLTIAIIADYLGQQSTCTYISERLDGLLPQPSTWVNASAQSAARLVAETSRKP